MPSQIPFLLNDITLVPFSFSLPVTQHPRFGSLQFSSHELLAQCVMPSTPRPSCRSTPSWGKRFPFLSVQSLYVVELELSLRMRIECREVYCPHNPSALLTQSPLAHPCGADGQSVQRRATTACCCKLGPSRAFWTNNRSHSLARLL